VSDPATARPAICLNMIVRNEAHIVHETLETVVPYISSWVIVDTGSDDGTQDVIRSYMAKAGIPGELHERPWRNFGHNRSEALELAQRHGDYIWVIDADDLVVGTLDFGDLTADTYLLQYGGPTSLRYWRRQLFRDGMPWRYEGVVHEFAECDVPWVQARVEGDYYINSRRLGSRNLDQQKYARDRDLLVLDVARHPDNTRSVFYLARSYYDMGEFEDAREWFLRRADMGGWEEEVFYARYQAAQAMAKIGDPWPEVEFAYLRAWEVRPTRAEPLFAIAQQYRIDQRYHLGHLFAERAAALPLPEGDELFVHRDVYAWHALDELAICSYWIGEYIETIALCQRLLAGSETPDEERERIAGNLDFSLSALIDAAVQYPEELVEGLVAGPRDSEVTVSLVAGPDRDATEQLLNSFLNSCADVTRVGRFLVVETGLSAEDRATLLERYGFLEFADFVPEDSSGARLAQIRREIEGRFWLHLGEDRRFFAPGRLISRLTSVFESEPEVFQVGVDGVDDAAELAGVSAAEEDAVRFAVDGGRYVLADVVTGGPAMFDTARLDRAGGLEGIDRDVIAELGRRSADAGLRTASLDEVFCVAGVPSEAATTSS
jgi:glycosyltransferase involved in cell wall biosynthesis